MIYVVQAAWANNAGEVEIPEGARILNAFYHPFSGVLGVAVLTRPVEPEPEEEPESDGAKEPKKEG